MRGGFPGALHLTGTLLGLGQGGREQGQEFCSKKTQAKREKSLRQRTLPRGDGCDSACCSPNPLPGSPVLVPQGIPEAGDPGRNRPRCRGTGQRRLGPRQHSRQFTGDLLTGSSRIPVTWARGGAPLTFRDCIRDGQTWSTQATSRVSGTFLVLTTSGLHRLLQCCCLFVGSCRENQPGLLGQSCGYGSRWLRSGQADPCTGTHCPFSDDSELGGRTHGFPS